MPRTVTGQFYVIPRTNDDSLRCSEQPAAASSVSTEPTSSGSPPFSHRLANTPIRFPAFAYYRPSWLIRSKLVESQAIILPASDGCSGRRLQKSLPPTNTQQAGDLRYKRLYRAQLRPTHSFPNTSPMSTDLPGLFYLAQRVPHSLLHHQFSLIVIEQHFAPPIHTQAVTTQAPRGASFRASVASRGISICSGENDLDIDSSTPFSPFDKLRAGRCVLRLCSGQASFRSLGMTAAKE